jgi:hypothetical protein
MLQVRCRDYGRKTRRERREASKRVKTIDVLACPDEVDPRRGTAEPDDCYRCGGPRTELGCADEVCAALTDGVAAAEYGLSARERQRRRDRAGTRIFGWNPRSRNRFRRKCRALDWNPACGPGLVLEAFTLTAPGRRGGADADADDDAIWMLVFPDGAAFHRALKRFRDRYEKRWCVLPEPVLEMVNGPGRADVQVVRERKFAPMYAVLKMEFQRRGAPHEHGLGGLPEDPKRPGKVHPEFREWLGDAWSDCVWSEVLSPVLGKHWNKRNQLAICEALEAIEPGAAIAYLNHRRVGTRVGLRDGRRIQDLGHAIEYFLKDSQGGGSKAYQDEPPEQWTSKGRGTGRIWQCWGLRDVTSTVAVTPENGVEAGRTARKWFRADVGRNIEQGRRLPFGPCRDEREQAVRDRAVRLEARRRGRRPSGAERRARRRRDQELGDDVPRVCRARARPLFAQNRGVVFVPDGVGFTSRLGRWLHLAEDLDENDRVNGGAWRTSEIGDGFRLMRTAGAAELARRRAAGTAHSYGGKCCAWVANAT